MYNVKKLPGRQATEILGRAILNKNIANKFAWLEPPEFENTNHITDVLGATSQQEHERLVRAWGDSVWQAWSKKHFQAIEFFITELGI